MLYAYNALLKSNLPTLRVSLSFYSNYEGRPTAVHFDITTN
jgi:hypothetical protein